MTRRTHPVAVESTLTATRRPSIYTLQRCAHTPITAVLRHAWTRRYTPYVALVPRRLPMLGPDTSAPPCSRLPTAVHSLPPQMFAALDAIPEPPSG